MIRVNNIQKNWDSSWFRTWLWQDTSFVCDIRWFPSNISGRNNLNFDENNDGSVMLNIYIYFFSVCALFKSRINALLVSFNPFFKFLFYFFLFSFYFILFFLILFYFLTSNTVWVLPNIKTNPPQVYMCSASWTLLPPPSPFHPSGSSQCTSPKHPVSCIEPGLATRFIHDILHVSMPFLNKHSKELYSK